MSGGGWFLIGFIAGIAYLVVGVSLGRWIWSEELHRMDWQTKGAVDDWLGSSLIWPVGLALVIIIAPVAWISDHFEPWAKRKEQERKAKWEAKAKR